MKRSCIFAVLVTLLLTVPAAAQEPTPEPNFDMPYNFQPLDYESGQPSGIDLAGLISDVGFINAMGSYVVTMWAMLDDYSFIGYLVIFLMAIWVLKWAASFVFKKDLMQEIDVGKAAAVIDDSPIGDSDIGQAWSQMGRALRKRPRF